MKHFFTYVRHKLELRSDACTFRGVRLFVQLLLILGAEYVHDGL
jgi:hypothetical protein